MKTLLLSALLGIAVLLSVGLNSAEGQYGYRWNPYYYNNPGYNYYSPGFSGSFYPGNYNYWPNQNYSPWGVSFNTPFGGFSWPNGYMNNSYRPYGYYNPGASFQFGFQGPYFYAR